MKQVTINLPSIDEVEFQIITHNEDLPVKGNAIASGDDAQDKEVEDEIIERLENGDIWAWCCVEVVAKWRGMKGNDFLGGCSYQDEKDFMSDGYYEDMKKVAYAALISEIEELED